MIVECKEVMNHPLADAAKFKIEINLQGLDIAALRSTPAMRESLGEMIIKEIDFTLQQQKSHEDHKEVEKQTAKILRKLPTEKKYGKD